MRPPLTRLRHSPLARLLVFGLLVLAITVPPYAPTVEAQADETLVSQGKLASASSSDSSGIYGPEHAVDDDSYRPWIADAAAPLPQWWMVDLGRSYALSRLTYHLYWEDFECANLYDLTIEASVDGQAWFQLLTLN